MNKIKISVITTIILIVVITLTIVIGNMVGSSDVIISAIIAAEVGIAGVVLTINAKKKGKSIIVKGEDIEADTISTGNYYENNELPNQDKKSTSSEIQVNGKKIKVGVIASGDVVKNNTKTNNTETK